MRKTLERCNKAIRRLKGNEGFSLVELIIVVAIMVALVAILAPQYFQYVEKSRKSVDITTADSILSAAKVIAIDPEYYDVAKGGFIVTWDVSDGSIDVNKTGLEAALAAAVGTTAEIKSKYATDAGSFTVTVTVGSSGEFEFATPTGWLEGTATAPAAGG